MASLLPIAHASHYLWLIYLPPVLIVVGAILRTMLRERREKRGSSPVGDAAAGD